MASINLYELLEVSKTASDDEIKKAYKKSALKYHPDRNPNNIEECTEKFKQVNKAFHILSDPGKRQKYDRFGVIDGDESSGEGSEFPGGFNPFNMFQNLFGNGMGGMPNQGHQQRNTKSPDKTITVNLTLADVYKGKSIFVEFNKIICCDECKGSGAQNKDCIKTCAICKGQGRIVQMRQMGPMIQQMVQPCGNCKGLGKNIEVGKECIKCKGEKCLTIKRHIDCYVKAGSGKGTFYKFKNESDWVPESQEVGDLIIYIDSKNEEGQFRREGNNLIIKKQISLLEALTKTEFFFKHLDERVLKVSYEEIIHPNQKMVIKEEGMIDFYDNLKHGDLIINFDIVFPNIIDLERSKYLVKILPSPKKQIWDMLLEKTPEENITLVKMEKVDKTENNSNGSNESFNYENYKFPEGVKMEEEMNDEPTPIQCSTQ
jgi:DnaJ family protein A protein 2